MRFSTILCPSEAPPPPKRLKTHDTYDDGEDGGSGALPSSSSSSGRRRNPHTFPLGPEETTSSNFDLDILDCSVCMEALSPPIFQCCNGHYACRGCTEKMSSKCPSCSEPTGKIRNLGLEKIIESLRVRCRFYNQGCPTGLLPYGAKRLHEQRCPFAPHNCPLSDCSFNGPLDVFSFHFQDCHNVRTLPFCYDMWFTVSLSLGDKYLLLEGDDTSFLFQAHEEGFGKLVYVSSFLPPDLEELYIYQMEVKIGKRHLTLASTVQSHASKKMNLNSIDFLLIPRCFFANEGFQVEVTIKRPAEFPEKKKKKKAFSRSYSWDDM